MYLKHYNSWGEKDHDSCMWLSGLILAMLGVEKGNFTFSIFYRHVCVHVHFTLVITLLSSSEVGYRLRIEALLDQE